MVLLRNMKNLLVLIGCLTVIACLHSNGRQNASIVETHKIPDLSINNKEITIAVIDTGVDKQHYVFKDTVFEKGWNFVDSNTNVNDYDGHGTHVTSIITNINRRAHILPLKFYSSKSSSNNSTNFLNALKFAIASHVQVINFSGGGRLSSNEEFQILKEAEQQGILVITAAGNYSENIDHTNNRFFPASYKLSNMMIVGSTDHMNNIAPTSNWGLRTVNIFAIGEFTYGAIPKGKYAFKSGTSQATAKISGYASLLLNHNRILSPQQVIKLVEYQSIKLNNLKTICKSGGVINFSSIGVDSIL